MRCQIDVLPIDLIPTLHDHIQVLPNVKVRTQAPIHSLARSHYCPVSFQPSASAKFDLRFEHKLQQFRDTFFPPTRSWVLSLHPHPHLKPQNDPHRQQPLRSTVSLPTNHSLFFFLVVVIRSLAPPSSDSLMESLKSACMFTELLLTSNWLLTITMSSLLVALPHVRELTRSAVSLPSYGPTTHVAILAVISHWTSTPPPR